MLSLLTLIINEYYFENYGCDKYLRLSSDLYCQLTADAGFL